MRVADVFGKSANFADLPASALYALASGDVPEMVREHFSPIIPAFGVTLTANFQCQVAERGATGLDPVIDDVRPKQVAGFVDEIALPFVGPPGADTNSFGGFVAGGDRPMYLLDICPRGRWSSPGEFDLSPPLPACTMRRLPPRRGKMRDISRTISRTCPDGLRL